MKSRLSEKLLYLLSPIGLLALWQGLLHVGIGDRRFIPAPTDIFWQFIEVTASGELIQHTLVTLYRVLAGYFLGAIPAIAVGLLMAMLKPVRIFFDPLIACLFPIPKVALMPLLLLAFGFGDASKIALVAIAVFFPVCVNTYTGASNIERIYWDVGKNYGASQWVMFRRVILPGALPTIFAGLRIALAGGGMLRINIHRQPAPRGPRRLGACGVARVLGDYMAAPARARCSGNNGNGRLAPPLETG